VSEGLPFLGFSIYPGVIRVRPENLRRSRRRLLEHVRDFERGSIDERKLADCVRSITVHLRTADTWNLRRAWFDGGRLASPRPPP